MIEKIVQMIIDFCSALSKAIVEWFNLTNTNVLYLQYIILLLPIIASVLKLPLSKAIKAQGFDPNGFKKQENVFKTILTVIIIFLYDRVVRQYIPSAIRDALTINEYGLYIFFAIILLMIAMSFIHAMLDCLATIHSCISFMIFGRSRRIMDAYDTGIIDRFKASAGLIGYSLGRLMDATAVLLGTVVLCYNYCM